MSVIQYSIVSDTKELIKRQLFTFWGVYQYAKCPLNYGKCFPKNKKLTEEDAHIIYNLAFRFPSLMEDWKQFQFA